MNETTKAHPLRKERGDYENYLNGRGLDVGCGKDPLKIPDGEVNTWDKPNGDGQILEGVENGQYDFVYSSHCLEHLENPEEAIANWLRVTKEGGHLYIIVPDYELYEKMQWPSKFGDAHKTSWSTQLTREKVGRGTHWHTDDLRDAIEQWGGQVLRITRDDLNYDYNQPPTLDQTHGNAMAQICIVARKMGEPQQPPETNGKHGTHYILEYGGGLGDIIDQCYRDPCRYNSLMQLGPNDTAEIIFVCHNPFVTQLFDFHPKIEQLDVKCPGYCFPRARSKRFKEWGITEAPRHHPKGAANDPPKPFISDDDRRIIDELPDRYYVMAASAGTKDRLMSPQLQNRIIAYARSIDLPIVTVGKAYERPARLPPTHPEGVIDLCEKVSVPGTWEVIERSHGLICTQSAEHSMANGIRRNQMMLYPQNVRDRYPMWKDTSIKHSYIHARFDEYREHHLDQLIGQEDKEPLLDRIEQARTSVLSRGRLSKVFDAANRTRHLPGQLAILGVYKGGSTMALSRGCPHKEVLAFETFTGCPNHDPNRDKFGADEWKDVNEQDTREYLGTENVTIVKGEFPDTAEPYSDRHFSAVFCDADSYLNALRFLEFFFPRMVTGGIILFDDYGFVKTPGVKEVITNFLSTNPERIEFHDIGESMIALKILEDWDARI